MNMWTIYRKQGWKLNDNDKVVNSILKRIDKCDGECPCNSTEGTHEDKCCPCKDYRENDVCHCGLYIKEKV